MEESDLVIKLEANDSSVRFVPFGFKTEGMNTTELAKNPYVVALAGQESAEKLAEVAGKHRNIPYLWSFESVDKPTTRVASLGSGRGLVVGGGGRGYGRGGLAFGVRKSAEGAAQK